MSRLLQSLNKPAALGECPNKVHGTAGPLVCLDVRTLVVLMDESPNKLGKFGQGARRIEFSSVKTYAKQQGPFE